LRIVYDFNLVQQQHMH